MGRFFRARVDSLGLGAALALSACRAGDGARADAAAQAGDATLTPERLAGWIAQVPNREPTRRDAETVSLVWIDYSLLNQAVARRRPLTDPATVTAALHPDSVMLTLRAWHDALVARRPRPAGSLVDSLYRSDSLRLYQHILIRVQDTRNLGTISEASKRVDSLLALAQAGRDFGELARLHSQDASAANNGYLPVARRGQLPPEFQRAAWRMAPGAMAAVVSRLGMHVVRRPPWEEARAYFSAWVDSLDTRRADSLHADSLRTARGFTISPSAVGVLRAFFENPAAGRSSTAPLATWEGGALSLDRAAIWIDLLPPASYADLGGGSDLALEGFVRDLALQYMLLEDAAKEGVVVDPVRWTELEQGYRRALGESLAMIGLSDSVSPQASIRSEEQVFTLLEGLAAERVRWRPLPSALGAILRAEMGYRLHRPGLTRAAESALETFRSRTPSPTP